jgi:hypothetical protein
MLDELTAAFIAGKSAHIVDVLMVYVDKKISWTSLLKEMSKGIKWR